MKKILILVVLLSFLLVTLASAETYFVCTRWKTGVMSCRDCGHIGLLDPVRVPSGPDWWREGASPTACPVGYEIFFFTTLGEARQWKELNCTCR